MKREDLEALGLSKEQIDKVCDMHHSELKPVKEELTKAQGDLKAAQDKAATTEAALKEFEGVNAEELNKKIEDLQEELKKKDEEYAAEKADNEFKGLLDKSISDLKGKNATAITALLDLDSLKASKNQKEDIAAALKALTEAEDSKMLFGEPEASAIGTADVIGTVVKTSGNVEEAAMRAAMGLPPAAEQK